MRVFNATIFLKGEGLCRNDSNDKVPLQTRTGVFNMVWPLVVVVVAQLVGRSLPIPEVRGSNPVIGKKLFIY